MFCCGLLVSPQPIIPQIVIDYFVFKLVAVPHFVASIVPVTAVGSAWTVGGARPNQRRILVVG